MAIERKRELRRRRHRKEKLNKLRAKLAAARNKAEREAIIAKIMRISPNAPLEK
jgi:hypothetical protein